MFADFKFFAIFATLALVWIPLVRGDDLKCYDSGTWKTLGSQKEVSCPNGICIGAWTAQPGKDEKTGALMCKPHVNGQSQDLVESIHRNYETFFNTLLKTTNKISASGSSNAFPIPGISLNGKATGYLKDIMFCHLAKCEKPYRRPFSEEKKVRLEIDANVGAIEFQVKLDQKIQFGRDNQGGDIKINKKLINMEICIVQPQVCIGFEDRRYGNYGEEVEAFEAFEKAALKEFGSHNKVTLTLGNEINFRITGNLKPLVEKSSKVKQAYSENHRHGSSKQKNAIEKIIGNITLEAKGNVDIDDSSDIEFSFKGNSDEILNQILHSSLRSRQETEYAFKICTDKKCLIAGQCEKNLCNHPEDFVKMANSAEGIKLSIVFMALNLLFLTKL